MKLLLKAYEGVRNLRSLPLPDEVIEASKAYMSDNDQIGTWFAEYFTVTNDNNDRVTTDSVWNQYRNQVDRSMGRVRFVRDMNNHGIVKKPARVQGVLRQCFCGVKKIIDSADSDDGGVEN